MSEIERQLDREYNQSSLFGICALVAGIIAILSLLEGIFGAAVIIGITTAAFIGLSVEINKSYEKHIEDLANRNFKVEQDTVKDISFDEDSKFVKLQNSRYVVHISYEIHKQLRKGQQVEVLYFNGEKKPFAIID